MFRSQKENARKALGVTVFVVALSFYHWSTQTSIYPVEILASTAVALTVFSVAILLRVLSGTSIAFTIRLVSIPVGLYVSLLSLIKAAELGSGFIGILLAVVTGGILFVSCMDARVNSAQSSRNRIACVLAILLALSLPISMFALFAQFSLLSLWQADSFTLVLGSFVSLYLIQDSQKSFNDRLIFASAYNVVLQAIIAVMMFVIATQWMESDVFLHKITRISISLILPLGLYLSTLIYAISDSEVRDFSQVDIKNWHIVEGYLFFMAMVVAPPSIIEYILSSQG